MNCGDFILKASEEGRAWVTLLTQPSLLKVVLPMVLAWLHGWHCQPPPWARKSPPTKEEG